MASIRAVRRGPRTYYYLTHSYRWGGATHKKQRYLGTRPPRGTSALELAIERESWKDTWFAEFERIKAGSLRRRAHVSPQVARKERLDFAVEFTYDSNRMEGSRLSFRETADLIESNLSPPDKPLRDVEESRAHARLVTRLARRPEPVDLPHLLRWHRELYAATKPSIAGRIRDFDVQIRRSRFSPPTSQEVRPALIELIRWVRRNEGTIHPVELAATFHCRFEQIHPFGDGNGPLGRIAMNVLLAQHDYPMLNIRFGKRRGYYRALERSRKENDLRPFLHWFFLRFSRALHWFRL
jgi:Fic family protein